MASQTSSSASTTSTSASSQSPASGSTSMPPNFDGNSSLPFSFLITFIAVFLFFLGCGLGSRRVTRQLRRNLGLQVAQVEARSASRLSEKPLLWDVNLCELSSLAKSHSGMELKTDKYAWENLLPLSATYVRATISAGERDAGPNHEADSPPPRWGASTFLAPGRGFMRTLATTPSLARPPPFHHTPLRRARPAAPIPEMRWRGHRLPEFIARPLLPPAEPGTGHQNSEVVELDNKAPVRGLEIAVVISMPCAARARSSRMVDAGHSMIAKSGKAAMYAEIEVIEVSGGQGVGEYVLGFARLPWDGEVEGAASSTKAA
ncbi:hypothetical protein BN946_scf184844.g111 [Trametes cinnabarina]|uniref:Uncharacterized protein n=1 Tax=Pycnoporus cinnabarinus TaxID=5643 RepID=A0A060S9B5_PYCCI|nr:hypothetical protein BN946_scf184844.g111 [Trametes cinnabarina]